MSCTYVSALAMLKITAIDNKDQRTLIVEGKLVDPWVAELERLWSEAQTAEGIRSIAIDLKDVTTISERGKAVLNRMLGQGAQVRCCRGVLTKHVVRRLALECAAHRKTQGAE